MDFSEPENWARIRREAEEFTDEHVTRDVIEHERRTGDGADRALTRKLGERGWIAAGWPVDEGGAGLDPFEAAAMWNALRKGGVPTAGPGTTMLPANAIRAVGSTELKARVLPGVAAGEVLICLGYTEPDGGSDIAAAKLPPSPTNTRACPSRSARTASSIESMSIASDSTTSFSLGSRPRSFHQSISSPAAAIGDLESGRAPFQSATQSGALLRNDVVPKQSGRTTSRLPPYILAQSFNT